MHLFIYLRRLLCKLAAEVKQLKRTTASCSSQFIYNRDLVGHNAGKGSYLVSTSLRNKTISIILFLISHLQAQSDMTLPPQMIHLHTQVKSIGKRENSLVIIKSPQLKVSLIIM